MNTPTSENRRNDPEKTKQDILEVATREFSTRGLAGARVDAIAEKTKTSKRMIYYYFGSKEALYLAVLEQAYRKIRSRESDLELSALPPAQALITLITNTFDHDEANPDFVSLVSIENIHEATHMKRSMELSKLNISILDTLQDILDRGYASGDFQRQVDAIDLHMMISALCFFRVSNRHTFGAIFGLDLSSSHYYQKHRQMVSDAIIAFLSVQPRLT